MKRWCRGAGVQRWCRHAAVVVQRFRAQQRRRCRGDAEVVGAGPEVQMCRCTVVLGAGMQGSRWCRCVKMLRC